MFTTPKHPILIKSITHKEDFLAIVSDTVLSWQKRHTAHSYATDLDLQIGKLLHTAHRDVVASREVDKNQYNKLLGIVRTAFV